MRRLRVAVVGGGIAGSALAVGLDPRSTEVTLIEAQPDRAWRGAGLGLWRGPQAALARLGVRLPESPSSAPPLRGGLFTITGRVLVRGGGVELRMIRRGALMEALDAAVPASVRRVAAAVDDPRDLDHDLIIGADGVRSRVRGVVAAGSPDAAPRLPTPYVVLRGVTTSVAPDEVGEYWGHGLLFGLVPIDGGPQHYWYSTHRATPREEPLPVGETLAAARAAFAGATPVVRRVLGDAGEETLATRLWEAPALRRYRRGRYVLVGDAAHGSLPNLGRGAGDALLDAELLARLLNRSVAAGSTTRPYAADPAAWAAVQGALRDYELRRWAPTQAARLSAHGLMAAATWSRR